MAHVLQPVCPHDVCVPAIHPRMSACLSQAGHHPPGTAAGGVGTLGGQEVAPLLVASIQALHQHQRMDDPEDPELKWRVADPAALR
jgi:hypothetical protein